MTIPEDWFDEHDGQRLVLNVQKVEALREAADKLLAAMDDMHEKGETFTPRVSLATSELRRLLTPTWPKDEADGSPSRPT